jgi:hypothetical protein
MSPAVTNQAASFSPSSPFTSSQPIVLSRGLFADCLDTPDLLSACTSPSLEGRVSPRGNHIEDNEDVGQGVGVELFLRSDSVSGPILGLLREASAEGKWDTNPEMCPLPESGEGLTGAPEGQGRLPPFLLPTSALVVQAMEEEGADFEDSNAEMSPETAPSTGVALSEPLPPSRVSTSACTNSTLLLIPAMLLTILLMTA